VDAGTHRIVAGLQGEFAEWGWDVSYNHQQLHQFTYGGYNRVMEWIRQAAGDSDACRAATNGCVPINLLGAPGSITREMLDFISEDTFTDIHAKLDSIVANATGKVFELPNGDVNLALGAEYRVEEFDQNSANRNQFIELGTTSDAHPPQRKVSEFYVETSLPLFADLPFMNSLDLDLAARYSHYNDFGNTTNPKVGLKWQVSDAVLLRASWGTGFRAPTFTEAFGAQTRGFQPVNDPCLGPNFAAYPGCNGQQATTTSSGAFVLRGGNPDLEPEEADNLTMGVVWRPEFFTGLALTLDYYEIEKTGIIGTANIDYVIEQNALNGSFSDRVTRDAGNAVFEVVLTRDNLLQQEIKGYDLGVEYATEQTAFGVFSGRVDLTYLDSHKQSPAPDLPAVERVGTYSGEVGTLAKYRWNGRVNWTLDNVDISTGIRYVDDVTNQGSLLVDGERLQTDDYLQADLLVDYLIEGPGITVSLGVENIFDEMPPWLEGNYFNGFDEGSFHSRGRFFYTRIEKLF
jgi:outer membrane receptor protein involved in Fe transport